MSAALLSTILDVAVLVFLGITIFYALKLSKSLNGFRKHRKELDALIGELSKNIDEAHRAIDGLRRTSADSGGALQEVINVSKDQIDELRIMTDMGDKLAARLDTLADKNRRSAQGQEEPVDFEDIGEDFMNEPKKSKAKTGGKKSDSTRPFFIQDRDFEQPEGGADLGSQAEKEFYEALQKNKKKAGGRSQ